ncbi:MAG: bifunctional glutamate N-acetyltransferase/amino-acid acetyltransferase ArgJ [Desulfuromonadales bacterium]|nr:bifunctional glutamate N-acetyltransferase/amino-acid acetyltransferase ArgJ [Desulfuromonadales bacterium]NIS41348.1 bifunctional glutamate N-acetyltransferase/amino-acid acetyltransferase ArgJ [Desulfuromonadales bacterium]
MIYSETPARCAGVFTTNKVLAPPVVVSAGRIDKGLCQAVVVNSGNANACTGEQGLRDALRSGELAAASLGIGEDLVAVSSTGVIGVALPMDKFENHVPLLAKDLQAEGAGRLAEAIMTTDAFSKVSSRQGRIGECDYTILGVAKGAGMIHPNMATMLGFIMTDADLDPGFIDKALKDTVAKTFNAITVDGDTSTNDMVLLLANGMSGAGPVVAGSPEGDRFLEQLHDVMLDLAKMIVRDGEGATKVVEVLVRGAADDGQARQAARSIATSSLVKTAFFGEDANWGRIIAAAGYSGADLDPDLVEIRFDDVVVVEKGLCVGGDWEDRASQVLERDEFTVTVDLKLGSGSASYYTSDLTYDYVKINADYRT